MSSTPSMSWISHSSVPGAHRCESHPAVAHDHGGDAMARTRLQQIVPGGLAVVVGVDVHEAGGDDLAGGVDGAGGVAGQIVTDSHDRVAHHGHVGGPRRIAGAVHQQPAADLEVVHGLNCRRRQRPQRLSDSSGRQRPQRLSDSSGRQRPQRLSDSSGRQRPQRLSGSSGRQRPQRLSGFSGRQMGETDRSGRPRWPTPHRLRADRQYSGCLSRQPATTWQGPGQCRAQARGVDFTKPNATALDCSGTRGMGTTPVLGA